MINFSHKLITTASLVVLCSGAYAQDVPPPAAADALPTLDGGLPALPAADPAGLPAADSSSLPALPMSDGAGASTAAFSGLPTAPSPFGAGATFPPAGSSQFGAAASAVPTPPPLTSLGSEAAETTTSEFGTTVSSTLAVDTYQFLFREDPTMGVVREKYLDKAAKDLRERRIKELENEYTQRLRQPGGLGAEAALNPGAFLDPAMGGDPTLQGLPGQAGQQQAASNSARATAEWDFYYEQLDMYNKYVSQKLLPNAEDIPEIAYDPLNALQERKDLKTAYEESAVTEVNRQYNENKEFYERLQDREDRRRAYYEWLLLTQQKVEDWTNIWARRTNGTRWADGEPVRRDDWYYGTDFNSADPVEVNIDNRNYLISKQPQAKLRAGELNVISSNLTPYDIIDANGQMKNPVMETLRGSLVVPPVEAIDFPATTGTLEIVP